MSKSKMEYKLQDITAEHIMNAVEAGCNKPSVGVTSKIIEKYAEISLAYANRALSCAVQLGMMQKDGNIYRTKDEALSVGRAANTQWPAIFAKFLTGYPPFILYVSQIARGDNAEDAGRKVSTIYDFTLDGNSTRRVLNGWGKYADVLEEDSNGLVLIKVNVETLDVETVRKLLEAMKSELNASVYITKRIGDEAFVYLGNSLKFLVSAILKHESDPRNSVEDTGKALEDFLRLYCEEKKIDTSRLNGIGTLTRKLFDDGFMLDKHQEICIGLNALRIAAAHGLDKKTTDLWTINPEAAMETTLLSLTMINSLFQYRSSNNLVL